MKLLLLILSVFLFITHLVYGNEKVSGRFIAVSKFMVLPSHNQYRTPRQYLIFETGKSDTFGNDNLTKVLYLPKFNKDNNSNNTDSGFLSNDDLDYKKERLLPLRPPKDENENEWCNQFDNYVRGKKNKIEKNEVGEDILQFQSTQFKADIKFDNLKEMPCMILEFFTK